MGENRPVRGIDVVTPEYDLARKDPAFPGLGVLLDPELFCGLVRTRARTDPGPGSLVDLHYRPGTECLATFRFGAGDDAHWVYARPLPDRASMAEVTGPDEDGAPGTGGGGGALGFDRLTWAEYGLLVRAFPHDDALETLALLQNDQRAQLMDTLVPGHRDPAGLSLRTLSYDAERRWVGSVLDGSQPVAALRIHDRAGFDRARWNARGLCSGSTLRMPAVLGLSPDHGALAVEWVGGPTVGELLRLGGPIQGCMEAVGVALAELHDQDAAGLPHCTPAAGTPQIRALGATLAFVLPRCAPRARELAQRLARGLLEAAPEHRPVHGQLRLGKVILQDGGQVALLDVDGACQGLRARDLGTLLAQLETEALCGRVPEARAREAGEALLRGHEAASSEPVDAGDIRTQTALALFELALRPFRRLQPGWPELTQAILERAEGALSR